MTVRPPHAGADVGALIHALEVHQAELVVQNEELVAANEELRRTNAELAFARDRYRVLQELAPAPLVTIDPGGVIRDVNLAAEALFATPRRNLIERRLIQFVVEAARAAVPPFIAALFPAGHAHGVELTVGAEGEAASEVVIDAVVLPDGDRARAVLGFVDVSARKRAEEHRRAMDCRAEHAQRLESLGVLAGGIAHEFNNLLTVVLAGTDHAMRLAAGAPLVEVLSEVRVAGRRAADLSQQMLAYAGHGSAKPQALDAGALLLSFSSLVRASAKTTPVVIDVADGLPWISGDAGQLRQLVLNLVMNAAEAMTGRPGSISVVARAENLPAGAIEALGLATLRPGRFVVLEVSDAGVGMDAATQARVFEPYYSTRFTGRGLGLAVVDGVARGWGGAVAVASVVGAGTTMSVYLPALPRRGSASSEMPIVTAAGRARTVLIVDDDLHVLRATARIVETLGHAVWTAPSGAEAIEIFGAAGARIDLILMDLTMPGVDGVDAATSIHALRADVPIVLVTGYGKIPVGAEDVFSAMLTKPFDIEDVRRVIETLVPLTSSS